MAGDLIYSTEVIQCAPVSHNYDPRAVEPFIIDAETDLRCDDCFGDEFFQCLVIDALVAKVFNACDSYTTDDIVIYGTLYFKANNDIIYSGTPLPAPPSDPSCWDPIDKFQNPNYQELWDKYLKSWLGLATIHASVMTSAYKLNTIGIMRNNSDFSESADNTGVMNLKNDLQNRKEKHYQAMHMFLTRCMPDKNIDNPALFPEYPPNKNACLDDCKTRDNSINIPFMRKDKRRRKRSGRMYDVNYYKNNDDECCD